MTLARCLRRSVPMPANLVLGASTLCIRTVPETADALIAAVDPLPSTTPTDAPTATATTRPPSTSFRIRSPLYLDTELSSLRRLPDGRRGRRLTFGSAGPAGALAARE